MHEATLTKVRSMWHLSWIDIFERRVTLSFKTKTNALAHAHLHADSIGFVTVL